MMKTKELDTAYVAHTYNRFPVEIVSGHGSLVTDDAGRTTRPGLFASGDVVKGARTVVEAVAYSKKVAEAMHEYMQSLPAEPERPYLSVPTAETEEGN